MRPASNHSDSGANRDILSASARQPETLDLIIDDLHDQRAALLACGVISKPWIPRIRKRIFAHVEFGNPESPVESWIKTFPDPPNSPAHYTHSLTIIGTRLAIGTGTDVGHRIRAFHNIIHLRVDTRGDLDGGPDFLRSIA